MSGSRGSKSSTDTALVWRRADYRESSRLVTLLTRGHGKLTALAKGAHRSNSPFYGRIDLLNVLELRLSHGSLPLMHRPRLLHEPRGLRQPRRYLAAAYLVELFDEAFPTGRVDPELFDLVVGGLRLVEFCPDDRLPQVVAALELRYLQNLGVCPDLQDQPDWLQEAALSSGRDLPELPPPPKNAVQRLGQWIARGTDRLPASRARALHG